MHFSVSYGTSDANELESKEALLMAEIAKMRTAANSDMSRSMVGGTPKGLDAEGLWTYWMVPVRVRLPLILAVYPQLTNICTSEWARRLFGEAS